MFGLINALSTDVIGVVSMCAIGGTLPDVSMFTSGVGSPSTTWIALMDTLMSSAQSNAGAALHTFL